MGSTLLGMAKGLTYRQRRFVAVYAGNGTEAARIAGYTGSDETLRQTASQLLTIPHVIEAIRKRDAGEVRPYIADRIERQRFWTSTMRNRALDLDERLHASELLGKSEADFKDKVEHSADSSFAELLKLARERAQRGG